MSDKNRIFSPRYSENACSSYFQTFFLTMDWYSGSKFIGHISDGSCLISEHVDLLSGYIYKPNSQGWFCIQIFSFPWTKRTGAMFAYRDRWETTVRKSKTDSVTVDLISNNHPIDIIWDFEPEKICVPCTYIYGVPLTRVLLSCITIKPKTWIYPVDLPTSLNFEQTKIYSQLRVFNSLA